MIRLGLFGCGRLNSIVVDCYKKGLLQGFEIVGCYSRTFESRAIMSNELGIDICNSYEELIARKPDYIVEATNPAATKAVLEYTLKNKVNMVLSSTGISSRKLAPYFNCPEQTIANKVCRGIVRIDDLIRIVDACNATLFIKTKDGIEIPLTLEDIDEPK